MSNEHKPAEPLALRSNDGLGVGGGVQWLAR